MKQKQSWKIGALVKVGFLTLEVVEWKGNFWLLKSPKSGQLYSFEPYQGLNKVVANEGNVF